MTQNEIPVNMKRDFKGIWICKEIWLNPNLSIQAKVLWAEIHSLYNEEKGGCYASDEYLMQFLQVKISRFHEIMKELKDVGYIEKVSFDGRIRIIKAIDPKEVSKKEETGKQGSGKPEGCIPEKCNPAFRKTGTLSYNIDNSIDKRLDKSPPTPKENKAPIGEVAIAPESANSKSSKSEISEKSLETANAMVEILKKNSPVYRPPRSMKSFHEIVSLLVDNDQQDPKTILEVLEWATNDREKRGNFPGWSSVIYGKTGIASFRKNFGMIYENMISEPKRKFAASSSTRVALADIKAKKGNVL